MKILNAIGVQKVFFIVAFLRCFYAVFRNRGIDSLPYGEEAYAFDTATSMNKSTIFATHEKDTESGLYFARNRMYDSASGRFTSVDPIKDGLNWFLYCDADPVNAFDPTGLWAIDTHLSDTVVIASDLISVQEAMILGQANINMDYALGIAGLRSGLEHSLHFNDNNAPDGSSGDSRVQFAESQFALAFELYMGGDKEKAWEELGKGMHALEDVFAHWEMQEHVTTNKDADSRNSKRNIVGLAMTEIVKTDYLLDFMEKTNQTVNLTSDIMDKLTKAFSDILENCTDPNQRVDLTKAEHLMENLNELIDKLKKANNASDPVIQEQIKKLEETKQKIQDKLESERRIREIREREKEPGNGKAGNAYAT